MDNTALLLLEFYAYSFLDKNVLKYSFSESSIFKYSLSVYSLAGLARFFPKYTLPPLSFAHMGVESINIAIIICFIMVSSSKIGWVRGVTSPKPPQNHYIMPIKTSLYAEYIIPFIHEVEKKFM
jgi:hypothetical protein